VTSALSKAEELIRQAVNGVGEIMISAAQDRKADLELRLPEHQVPVRLQLQSWPEELPRDRIPPHRPLPNLVWVLRRAPTRLLGELRRDGQNFVDVSRGVVRLALPGVFIDRTDLEPASRVLEPRRLRDPFADRASLIARTLFRQPDRDWGTRELAQAAGVSPMLASDVVRQLANWDVVDTARHGREARIRLKSERRLVEVWTSQYDWKRNPHVAFAAPIGDPLRFLRRLPETFAKHRWALTMQSGASLVAPHATWDKVHVYIDVPTSRDLRPLGITAGWSPDSSGRIVLMQPRYDESVWPEIEKRKELPVVSLLQLILDLWHYPVRGREQAEHLLQMHMARRSKALPANS
jgi:hypothetical protein